VIEKTRDCPRADLHLRRACPVPCAWALYRPQEIAVNVTEIWAGLDPGPMERVAHSDRGVTRGRSLMRRPRRTR